MNGDACWPFATLKDLCSEIEYGYTAKASIDAVGPRFLRITDVVQSHLDWSRVPRCEISSKDQAKFLLRDGDIVVARTGATVGYGKLLRTPPEAVFASYLVRFRVSEGVDARFVGAAIESADYKAWVKRQAGGAAQPNANAQVLAAYPMRLPPLHVQNRIGSIFSAYEDLIEVNRRRIALLEEMARRLFEEWFVHFRFPGSALNDVDGKLPTGWKRVPIEQVYEGLYDGPHATPKPSTEGPVFLGIGNITEGGQLDLSSIRHISEAEFPTWTKRVTPRADDIVFTYEATLNRYAIIPNGFRGCLGRRLALIRTEPSSVYRNFLFLYFFSADWRETITRNMLSGATVERIPLSKFPTFPINLPPQALAAKFDGMVQPAFDQAENIRKRNAVLQAQRDLVLPRLISGEVSSAANREFEAVA
jgi:type I restriction enzyme S subunit